MVWFVGNHGQSFVVVWTETGFDRANTARDYDLSHGGRADSSPDDRVTGSPKTSHRPARINGVTSLQARQQLQSPSLKSPVFLDQAPLLFTILQRWNNCQFFDEGFAMDYEVLTPAEVLWE